MPSSAAFSFFAGPIFSPARINDVLPEIDEEFLPPLFSIISLYSSLECFEKVPDITIVFPDKALPDV